MKRTHLGIIGCGKIAPAYIRGCGDYDFLDIVAVADLDMERARAFAAEHGVPRALTVGELLAAPDIDIVINLTVPKAHLTVNSAVLEAGKHVYVEKPLTLSRVDAAVMLKLARSKRRRVGCAPDTFLGGGVQTCRKLIDDGAIGEPVAATAFCCGHGHESWHPSPKFYYEAGGGPMWDMGPYYLTALVNCLGPARRVSGSTKATFPTRTITSEPMAGTVIPVEVSTHIAGTIDFQNNTIATVIMSFDMWGHHLPRIEIYGTEGTLVVPDPNAFAGEVLLKKGRDEKWQNIPLTHCAEVSRGTGVADMALAIRGKRPHRASGALAAHVVDIMQAFDESSEKGRHIRLKAFRDVPAALPPGLPKGALE